jgi:hypothetical protein
MSTDWLLLGLRILAPILLYLFLGILIYRLFKERLTAQPFILRRLDKLDTTLPLSVELSIGRDVDNGLVLNDETVSAHHALISHQAGVWQLTDLGSEHGTLINDMPVRKPARLRKGDIICFGDVVFRVEQGN